ncbi:hypothetical protein SUGI_0299370 [Cryptomeria japonica]|nr:hypothetical protein SUGI_0299370 [Cryptomeria japonica]
MSTKGIQWSDFCDVRVKRGLTVGTTLQMLQQFYGISAVLFYTPTIIKDAKVDEVLSNLININKNSATLLASAMSAMPMLFFILLGMWLMDRAGRRSILPYTTPILFLTMVIMSLVRVVHLPSVVQSVVLLVVTLSFPALNNLFGAPAVFRFFAFMSLVSWVFTFLKVPESKGIPLEIITEFFALFHEEIETLVCKAIVCSANTRTEKKNNPHAHFAKWGSVNTRTEQISLKKS